MKSIYLVLITLLLMGCATQKQAKLEEQKFSYIQFGSRAGFTGFTTEYVVKNDGTVYTVDADTLTYLNKVDNEMISYIDSLIMDMDFETLSFREKGNPTYRIQVTCPKYTNQVVWTDRSKKAEKIKRLYKTLVMTLK